jgi:uncharacterized protein
MRREEALRRLAEHKADLDGVAVKSLSVFGSVARDEAGPESDVDLLVEFTQPVGFIQFHRLQTYLEELLGCKVDMVTPAGLREPVRGEVLEEAIRAA